MTTPLERGDPREVWLDLEADAAELIAQADRLLRHPDATAALRKERERAARNLEDTRQTFARADFRQTYADGRVIELDPWSLIDGTAHWLLELSERVQRELVRGEPDAQRSRRARARIRPGMRVGFSPPGRDPLSGTVAAVIGTRAKIATDDGSTPWSVSIFQVEVLDDHAPDNTR